MTDRTIVPLDNRPIDCVCGPPTDLGRLTALLHGWPLVFTAVATIALCVLTVLLIATVTEQRREHSHEPDTADPQALPEGTSR
ncbi:MAG: hypothetical protein WBB00_07695 [Mycobacterium sp.]